MANKITVTRVARIPPHATPPPVRAGRDEMIATAAYFLSERRGFTPGHEIEDWIAAEAAIDRALGVKNAH